MTNLNQNTIRRSGGAGLSLSVAALALSSVVAGPVAAALPSGPDRPVAANEFRVAAANDDARRAPAPAAPAMNYMQLQAQYRGPLQDTIIQRWRDPIDGRICYVYLPVVVQHSQPTPMGLVEYGSNNIGSISCTNKR